MKKLVYTLAVIFTLSLVSTSCTKQELDNEEQLVEKKDNIVIGGKDHDEDDN